MKEIEATTREIALAIARRSADDIVAEHNSMLMRAAQAHVPS
jgi:hypothetical protein